MFHWPNIGKDKPSEWSGDVCSSFGEGGIKNSESNTVHYPFCIISECRRILIDFLKAEGKTYRLSRFDCMKT